MNSAVRLLVKLFGNFRTILLPVFEPELEENFKSLGLIVVHLKISDHVDVIHCNVAVLVSDAVVLEEGFVVQVVLKFLLEEDVGGFDEVVLDFGIALVIKKKYRGSR